MKPIYYVCLIPSALNNAFIEGYVYKRDVTKDFPTQGYSALWVERNSTLSGIPDAHAFERFREATTVESFQYQSKPVSVKKIKPEKSVRVAILTMKAEIGLL